MLSMSTCGELTSVPERRHLAILFVLLAGCSYFQQSSAVQLQQVTIEISRTFYLLHYLYALRLRLKVARRSSGGGILYRK